ncbi:MAG: hypothetical protein AMK69_16310 [Nitrospira bacterium SG8_3]|nr:MAG: hypothetical protein AMK69_16310 [Nitrospira bacterium SG8_3]
MARNFSSFFPYAMATDEKKWEQFARWWIALARRHGVAERTEQFFHQGLGPQNALDRAAQEGADLDYILFTLIRHWIPPVLPPTGQERTAKNDSDYWLESERILKAAVARLRELKPVIDMLTTPSPLAMPDVSPRPEVEVELANMLEGIAEVVGGYGGPDYTSIIKNFDPIPLRQTQPFKHNKKHSAELWVVFLLREHFRNLGLGKDRSWKLIAQLVAAADIFQSEDQPSTPEALKSWWTKNWPRTYTLLTEKGQEANAKHTAYQSDYDWFRAWFNWQTTSAQHTASSSS